MTYVVCGMIITKITIQIKTGREVIFLEGMGFGRLPYEIIVEPVAKYRLIQWDILESGFGNSNYFSFTIIDAKKNCT